MSHTPQVPGVRGDRRARESYAEGAGIYRIVPQWVAAPRDPGELRALLRWASAGRIAIIPRGAGSAMGGGNVGDGLVLDLTGIAGDPVHFDPAAARITVPARTTLGEIDTLVRPAGLRLPPDPSSSRWATSGGVLSTNAAGPRSLRYGAVRAWVDAADLVLADGESVRLQRGRPTEGPAAHRFDAGVAPLIRAADALIRSRYPRTLKNSSGYALDAWLTTGDLLDLFIGAEGTLGIIESVTWRLAPRPTASATLRVEVPDLSLLGTAVSALVESGPASCELLDRTFLTLVGAPELEGLLLLEYEGDSLEEAIARVEEGMQAAARIGLPASSARTREAEEEFWAIRHAASPILAQLPPESRSLQVVEDGCVPIDRLADYVRLLRNAAKSRSIGIVLFGHAGSGHLHANILPDVTRPGWDRAVHELLFEVTAGIIALGGTLAGEHGDGRLRAGLLEALYGPEIVELFRRVKQSLDPLGLLNPGVILPARDVGTPVDRLKVGAAAARLDDDIATALRRIEREGGYDRPRLSLADSPVTGTNT